MIITGKNRTQIYTRHWRQPFSRNLGKLLPVDCVQVEGRDGLLLLPGHVNLSEYEVTLGIAQELAGSIQALKNLPGAFHFLLTKIAQANRATIFSSI